MRRFKSLNGLGRAARSRSALVSIAAAAAVLIFSTLASAQALGQKPSGTQTSRRIPIMTWPGPDTPLLSLETFRTEAAAGFSVNFSSFGDRTINVKALDLARAAGLKLMVYDSRIEKLLADKSLPLDPLAAVVNDYRSHPALFGYFITDEPNAAAFERLGAIVKRLRELDPDHPAYINLFPTYANEQQLGTPTYEEHVTRFLETVRPPFVSYDHYPVRKSGLRPDYYRNLEIIRRMSMERGLAFWAFTLVTPHYDYPPPTAGHIRLQLFSDLAYGAKALQYFTYGTPGGADEFGTGLIGKDGIPGPAYPFAREVNAEIRRIEDIVLRWRSEAVYHSDPVPDGAKPLPSDAPVRSVSGAPLVVGILSDGPATYVMLVNRDYENPRTAFVRFAAHVRELREIAKNDKPTANVCWPADQDEHYSALDFAPGDARIFRLK